MASPSHQVIVAPDFQPMIELDMDVAEHKS